MSDTNDNAGNQYDRPNQEAVRQPDTDNVPDVPENELPEDELPEDEPEEEPESE